MVIKVLPDSILLILWVLDEVELLLSQTSHHLCADTHHMSEHSAEHHSTGTSNKNTQLSSHMFYLFQDDLLQNTQHKLQRLVN